jgi:hypothetical protein
MSWYNRKNKQVESLRELVKTQTQITEGLEQTINNQSQRILELEKAHDSRMLKISNGYVELLSFKTDTDGQIKMELDWDGQFIDELKSVGYTGVDDDAIIQKYVANIARQVSQNMILASGNSETRGSEFQ